MRAPIRSPSDPERDDLGRIVSALDWLGNRFRLGDPVIYTVNGAGTSVRDIAIGKVTNIVASRHADWTGAEYDIINVQVLTAATGRASDNRPRLVPCWPRAYNITALTGLPQAVRRTLAKWDTP